jgi:predicted membrane-bound spermidine synthase
LKINITTSLLLNVLALASFSLWVLKIHDFYFDISIADIIAILLLATFSFFLGMKYPLNFSQHLILVLTATIALGIYPFISLLKLYFNDSWYLIYLSIALISWFTAHLKTFSHSLGSAFFLLLLWILPYPMPASQKHYNERIIQTKATRKGDLHVTQWKNDLWYYYNQKLLFSSLDGHMYGEAATHPAIGLIPATAKVLVLGGDNGLIVKELMKYSLLDFEILPYDHELSEFIFDQTAIDVPKEKIIDSQSILGYLDRQNDTWDAILVDLPLPVNFTTNQYYSKEFFNLCQRALKPNGIMVSSVGDPMTNFRHVQIVENSIDQAFDQSLSYQLQIPTIGQWSWTIAGSQIPEHKKFTPPIVKTKWINEEALAMLLASGNPPRELMNDSLINTIKSPILIQE